MPHVGDGLVRRLLGAPAAPAVAPRRDGRWEPFFARYDAPRALPVARAHANARRTSLQALLDALGATELALGPDEARELRDWDRASDIGR
jgi:molybdopterin-guanine dinucleotide biosynthesis protein A